MTAALRHVFARVRGADAAEAVLALLDDAAGAVSAFETTPAEWRIEAYPRSSLLTPDFSARLALAAAAAGGELIEIHEQKTHRPRLVGGKPTRLSAVADRPVFCLRLASPRRGAGRGGRHHARRGHRLRHRRASLDPRLPDGARSVGAAPGNRPSARYRHRHRDPVDRRGETAAPPGAGKRHRSWLGRGRPP